MLSADEDRVFEFLDEATCRLLLGTTRIGRLGFTDGALPTILPVPFALHCGRVVIPTRRGSSVVPALRGAVVAFEVGSYDADTRTGWSVTVVGPTRLVSLTEDVAALEVLHFSSYPPALDRCYISVQPGLLRGWRTSETAAGSGSPGSAAEVDSSGRWPGGP